MNSELARRIAFTLGALLVYRIGSHIPLPGINPAVWDQIFQAAAGGLLGMLSTLSGGALARLSVFSLGIVPYVSAAILVQLASFFVPRAARAARRRRAAGAAPSTATRMRLDRPDGGVPVLRHRRRPRGRDNLVPSRARCSA